MKFEKGDICFYFNSENGEAGGCVVADIANSSECIIALDAPYRGYRLITVKEEFLYDNKDDTLTAIDKWYASETKKLRKSIKEYTVEDEAKITNDKYDLHKQQIINTMQNIVDDYNNNELIENVFINRLKNICREKTNMFSIKIPRRQKIEAGNFRIAKDIKRLQSEHRRYKEFIQDI